MNYLMKIWRMKEYGCWMRNKTSIIIQIGRWSLELCTMIVNDKLHPKSTSNTPSLETKEILQMMLIIGWGIWIARYWDFQPKKLLNQIIQLKIRITNKTFQNSLISMKSSYQGQMSSKQILIKWSIVKK